MAHQSTVRSRELGRRLRAIQESAGYKGGELAKKLDWDHPTWSKVLSGRRVPKDWEVATILGLCDAVGPEYDDIMLLCDPYQDMALRLPVEKAWPVYLAQVREAIQLIQFEPAIVPWSLQTPDYTRALFQNGGTPAEEAPWSAARREALDLLRLDRLDLLVHEWALRTPVGDDALMSEQLHHLLRLSVRPNLSLRVVPVSRRPCPGRHGGFTLLEYAQYSTAVYREDEVHGVLSDDQSTIQAYRSVLGALNVVALDEQQSRDWMNRTAVALY